MDHQVAAHKVQQRSLKRSQGAKVFCPKPLSVPNDLVHVMTLHSEFVCGIYDIHVLMRDEKEGRKKQARSNKQQHSTPKAVTFLKKNELPQVGLEPTTLYTLDRALYHLYM